MNLVLKVMACFVKMCIRDRPDVGHLLESTGPGLFSPTNGTVPEEPLSQEEHIYIELLKIAHACITGSEIIDGYLNSLITPAMKNITSWRRYLLLPIYLRITHKIQS